MFWKSLQGAFPGWGTQGSSEEAKKSPAVIWGQEDKAMGGLLGGLKGLEASPSRGSEAVAPLGAAPAHPALCSAREVDASCKQRQQLLDFQHL